MDEMPTAERYRYEGFELDELASADETISDDQVFEDAASYKSSDDDLDDVDRMLAEK